MAEPTSKTTLARQSHISTGIGTSDEISSSTNECLFDASSSAMIASLPCDSISEILVHADFESAVNLANLISTSPSTSFASVWNVLFFRQVFAPDSTTENYLDETKHRRRLLQNLTCPPRNSSSFSLPHSCFRFVPIRPDDNNYLEDDPPPVDFDCDSFLLLSPTRPEYLGFNPFSGRLVLYQSILDGALTPQDFVTNSVAAPERSSEPDRPNCTVLHEGNFSLDLHDFGFAADVDNNEVEIEVMNIGIESKHTVDHSVVALGRILVNLMQVEATLLTEVRTWERCQGQRDFGSARICRFRHGFYTMELDPLHLTLYVNIENEMGSTHIHVYPLVPCEVDASLRLDPSVYCPTPLTTLNCREGVTGLACSGDVLLVATFSCKIQLYERHKLIHTLSVAESVRTALQGREIPVHMAPVDVIRFAQHLGIEHGFVTLQHDDDSGNTLLLWTPATTNKKDQTKYQVDTIIQLPLLPRRIPKIHFDGRRLIVYGQDHIGFLLLVYKVWSADDQESYHSNGSGGVIVSKRLNFVHRIRHAALGGHLDYESIHMTCNDRFLVLNTKMGHELVEEGGSDGLLVIDLENAGKQTSALI